LVFIRSSTIINMTEESKHNEQNTLDISTANDISKDDYNLSIWG